ncbi:hypothetical protein P7C70_g9371, partial [Phenoliferia sp. Uapishka_3]
ASASVSGTAFLSTPQSLFSSSQKSLIISSSSTHTLRTMNFDYARNTLGWGEGVDGRGLANETSRESAEWVGSVEGRKVYDEAVKGGDVSRIVTWAGSSVGEVKNGVGAEEVVRGMEKEAVETLRELGSLLT